jgi:hypothetical protein
MIKIVELSLLFPNFDGTLAACDLTLKHVYLSLSCLLFSQYDIA